MQQFIKNLTEEKNNLQRNAQNNKQHIFIASSKNVYVARRTTRKILLTRMMTTLANNKNIANIIRSCKKKMWQELTDVGVGVWELQLK